MTPRFQCRWYCFVFPPLIALPTGCSHQPAVGAPPPAEVTVAQPVERNVPEFADFTGRTESVEAVEIRARVTGYLDKIDFEPGSIVKKGDPLFEIDARTYKADWDKAESEVARTQARLTRLTDDLERVRTLGAAISKEELAKYAGDKAEADAGLKSARSVALRAKLDFDFTKITAPLAGRISRTTVTVGNLVKADTTTLTTIVSVDQMFVYFDVDENTHLRYQQRVRDGELKGAKESAAVVLMRLANETGYPHKGKIDFAENQLNRGTGTIQVRAVFPNADEVLKSGQFAEIRIPLAEPRKSMLIPEDAVGSDQGQKFVYVVDAQNKVEYRKIRLGVILDGYRVVEKSDKKEENLKPDEWIIVKGLQRVRDGSTVTPKRQIAEPSPNPKG